MTREGESGKGGEDWGGERERGPVENYRLLRGSKEKKRFKREELPIA